MTQSKKITGRLREILPFCRSEAVAARSPLSTPYPLLLPVLPEKESVLRRLFLIFVVWAVPCGEYAKSLHPGADGNHAFPFGDVNSDSCDDVVCHGFQPPNHVRRPPLLSADSACVVIRM